MSLTKVSFSMITGSVFNVIDYGAVGNGSTADLTDIGGYARVIGNYFSVAPTLAGTDFTAANQI